MAISMKEAARNMSRLAISFRYFSLTIELENKIIDYIADKTKMSNLSGIPFDSEKFKKELNRLHTETAMSREEAFYYLSDLCDEELCKLSKYDITEVN